VTGSRERLAFVSPRTGRAVAEPAAGPYRGRLLPLPGFLLREAVGEVSGGDIADGLALTGHFLARHAMGDSGKGLPAARERLMERLGSAAAKAGSADHGSAINGET
jgi:DNA repair protein RecO (recombination protein O)